MAFVPTGRIATFTRREYAATIAALVGAGTAIYGGVSSANAAGGAPSGLDTNDINKMGLARPLGMESILSQLSLQTLYELGVSSQALEEELLYRKLSEARLPMTGRNAQALLGEIRSYAATGDTAKAQKKLAKLNQKMRKAGVTASINGNDVGLTFLGPEQEQINSLRANEANQQAMFQNRLNAMGEINNIIGGFGSENGQLGGGREQEASAYLNSYLDETQRTETDRITAQANALGITPGGQLSELDKKLAAERYRIANGGALERALALANGEIGTLQKGLQPSMLGSTQTAANSASSDFLQSLGLGLSLANSNAQAEAARSAGLANSYSALGQSGASLTTGASNYLSSTAQRDALSGKTSG